MARAIERKILITIATALVVVLFSSYSYAAGSVVNISNYTAPTVIEHGQRFVIKGTLTSNYVIRRVEVGVVYPQGRWTSFKYDNRRVNSRSFNLAKADSSIRFGNISPGTYYYRIYAHTNDGKVHTLMNRKFTIKAAPGKITTSGLTYPTTLVRGNGFVMKGRINASKKIRKVTAGVAYTSGKWTSYSRTRNVNSTSFNIAKIDPYIKFGKIYPGTYDYKIVVTTTGGSVTVLKRTFKVVSNAGVSTTPNITSQPASAPAVNLANDSSANKITSSDGKVSLSGANLPGTYTVGAKFNPVGSITSSEPIKRVEVGIVFAPTNKWLNHKYDASGLNTTSFNINSAASRLRFDLLPAGLFRYRIYVHTNSGVYLLLNHKFEVKTNGKPQAAVNWATRVANNNNFAYGTRPATAKVGCYYCGTNQRNKPRGYEKTYVCMTFAHAAYAHGANDPGMLADCKGGRYTLSLNDWNFSHYDCWEKIGLCKDLTVADLLPGDVIIWWADDDYSGHASIYAGNGNIVDAGKEGWGADTIAVRSGSAARYLSTGASFSSRSYVMRYRK